MRAATALALAAPYREFDNGQDAVGSTRHGRPQAAVPANIRPSRLDELWVVAFTATPFGWKIQPALPHSYRETHMFRTTLLTLAAAALLSACETPTTQRYAISPDNNVALKALGATGVGVGTFTPPARFDETCRALGPLRVADNLSHTQYIQKAFEDELKVAGAHATASPRLSLSGKVDKLEFSSSRGLTGGSWTIALSLASSNGQQMSVNEYYEFDSGFSAPEACRQTAEAFSRAVQNLIGKAVRTPAFAALLR